MSEHRCDFFDSENGCGLNVVDRIPSPADCASCSRYSGPRRGLGDDVHRVVKAIGIDRVVHRVTKDRDCGCGERRRRLNEIAPARKD